MVIARITNGGGAGQTINEASGNETGLMSILTNPLVLIGGAVVAWKAMM